MLSSGVNVESRASVAAARLSKLIVAGCLFLVLWIPIPLGSNRDWSMALFAILTGCLFLLWVLMRLYDEKYAKFPSRVPLWMFLLLVSVQIWVSLQLLVGLHHDPGAGYVYLLLGIALTLLFLMIVTVFSTRERINLLLGVLVASGMFQAFFGSFMVLSGIEWLPGMPKEFYRGVATGTYVNRNHLAGYLVMTIGCAIALLFSSSRSGGFKWRDLAEMLLGPKARIRLALVIMVIGLVMTASRMGNTAFFTSLLLVGTLYVIAVSRHRLRNGLILLSILLIDLLIIGHYFGLEKVVERLSRTEVSVEHSHGEVRFDINDMRGKAYKAIYPLIADKPWQGYGAGSFETVFVGHSGPGFDSRFEHAHNDYLQFWMEYGLAGVVPLAIFVITVLWLALRSMLSGSTWRGGVGFGLLISILGLMIHAASDFNLQIPANAATFVVLCAVVAGIDSRRLRSSRGTARDSKTSYV